MKLAVGPYCRQYKTTACFFFLWLSFFLSKMCLEVAQHILVLPITHFRLCYAHLGTVSTSIIFWENRWIRPRADKGKKKKQTILPAISTHCWFSIFPEMSKWDFTASRYDPDYLEILRVLNSLTVLSTVNQMFTWLAWSTYCSAEPVYMQGITPYRKY
jgi:hypothetical protein